MIQNIFKKLVYAIYSSNLKKIESKIGFKIKFRKLPSRFINGWAAWNMTRIWKKSGLDIEKGANYFTIGRVDDGRSLRFDKNAPEYQSWLGGYTVKLTSSTQTWTVEDHFKLAIADQNNWLKLYGDPNPKTNIDNWTFSLAGEIKIGQYLGKLYEGGCNTHSDVGAGCNKLKTRIACSVLAMLFNFSNKNLELKGSALKPKIKTNSYEPLKLHGYIAIFNISKSINVVLYGNGVIVQDKNIDTFLTLKNSILEMMKHCDIVMR